MLLDELLMPQETMTVEQFKQARGERNNLPQAKQRQRHESGVMNKTEAKMDFELDLLKRAGKIKHYSFESHKLKLAKRTWFTIDFWIEWADGTIECRDVKGGPPEDDFMVKIKVAADKFRQYKFTIWYAERGGAWQEEVVCP